MEDDDHHIIDCPLNPLPIGFVSQFALDYMHLACLGVMRRLLLYWKGPVGPLEVRLGKQMICSLSYNLLILQAVTPLEFARKPRCVEEVLRWKATEFREFMVYSGFVVLKGILNDQLYDHFMLLFVALRILMSPQLAVNYCDYANELLVKFVNDGKVLYGTELLVYNVHSLTHLANDVKNLGCLDEFSAFKFENKLGQLKRLVRKPQNPLQQIFRCIHEERYFGGTKADSYFGPRTKSEHFDGPLIPSVVGGRQYRYVITGKYTLSARVGNSCILLKCGTPVLIRNIVENDTGIHLLCSKFASVTDAFLYPLPSSKLNICKVKGECSDIFSVMLEDILSKCTCWPVAGEYIAVTLLH